MNPLHVPLSFLRLLLVPFLLSFHGWEGGASLTFNEAGVGGVMEGAIITFAKNTYASSLSSSTTLGSSNNGRQQYRIRPAGLHFRYYLSQYIH
jgi:hypothetical protein